MNVKLLIQSIVEVHQSGQDIDGAIEMHQALFDFYLKNDQKKEDSPKPPNVREVIMNSLIEELKEPKSKDDIERYISYFGISSDVINWSIFGTKIAISDSNETIGTSINNEIFVEKRQSILERIENADKHRPKFSKRLQSEIKYHPLRQVRRSLNLSIKDVVAAGLYNPDLIARFERKELKAHTRAVYNSLREFYDKCLLNKSKNVEDKLPEDFENYTEEQIEQYYAEQAEKLQNSGSDIPPLLEEKTAE